VFKMLSIEMNFNGFSMGHEQVSKWTEDVIYRKEF